MTPSVGDGTVGPAADEDDSATDLRIRPSDYSAPISCQPSAAQISGTMMQAIR